MAILVRLRNSGWRWRQIAANRRNAKKSSGPRSARGKARSCRNALSPRSNNRQREDPFVSAGCDDVGPIAVARRRGSRRCGLTAAEAEIDLLRIRNYRATLVEELRGRGEPFSSSLIEKLAKLDRYERGAYSRRQKALRAI